jgi:hypothetical protein
MILKHPTASSCTTQLDNYYFTSEHRQVLLETAKGEILYPRKLWCETSKEAFVCILRLLPSFAPTQKFHMARSLRRYSDQHQQKKLIQSTLITGIRAHFDRCVDGLRDEAWRVPDVSRARARMLSERLLNMFVYCVNGNQRLHSQSDCLQALDSTKERRALSREFFQRPVNQFLKDPNPDLVSRCS